MSREKRKLLHIADGLIEDKDNSDEIYRIDDYLLNMLPVASFDGFGDDKEHDKNFESVCAYLGKETTRNVKTLTVMEFYSLLSNVRKDRPKKKKVKAKV